MNTFKLCDNINTEYEKMLASSGYCSYLWEHYYQILGNLLESFTGELDSNIFTGIAKCVDDKDLECILEICLTPAIKKDFKTKRIYRPLRIDFDEDPAEDIFEALWLHPQTQKKLRTYLLALVAKCECQMPECKQDENSLVEKRLQEIRKIFQLEDDEYYLFVTLVVFDTELCGVRHNMSTCNRLKFISIATGIAEKRLIDICNKSSKLYRFGCINSDFEYNSQFRTFLAGIEDTPLVSKYYFEIEEETLPWDYFETTVKKHGDILKKLLDSYRHNKSMNILLYGEPGTGKTSFAKSLAKKLGFNLCGISQSGEDSYSKNSTFTPEFRFGALEVCQNQIIQENSMIMIDEADDMLQHSVSRQSSMHGNKGMINSVLDNVRIPCIWITNNKNQELDESSRRRFDYSIKFEKLGLKQRMIIWGNSINKHHLQKYFSAEYITSLAESYAINAGGIDITLSNAASILKAFPEKAEDIDKVIEQLLTPYCELLEVETKSNRNNKNNNYCLDGLNLKGVFQAADIIVAAKKFRQDTEVNADFDDIPRFNVLLTGEPGTGKTEFVKYLADQLNCRLITKMGSDFLDMFVGGTEKNIKQAFREAEDNNAILFIDEADGMLRSRELSKNSWEVTQVNELLYAMENFDGILFCATNFVQNLDKATIRRFTLKLEFDYLNNTGKKQFFEKFFSDLTNYKFNQQQKLRLDAIANLTPGDFRTVRQSLYYLGWGNISCDALLSALEEESHAKHYLRGEKVIGF